MGSVMSEEQIFWAVDVDGCIMVLFLIDNMGSGDPSLCYYFIITVVWILNLAGWMDQYYSTTSSLSTYAHAILQLAAMQQRQIRPSVVRPSLASYR